MVWYMKRLTIISQSGSLPVIMFCIEIQILVEVGSLVSEQLEEKIMGYVIILLFIDMLFEGEPDFIQVSMFLRIFIFVCLWLAKPSKFTTFQHVLRQKGYPSDHCITPRKLNFLFAYRKALEGGNDIPKEIVDKNIFGFYNVIFSAVVLLGIGKRFGETIVLAYFWIDALVILIVMTVLSIKAEYVAFINQFKKLNRYNWKYFSKNVFDHPLAEKLGECTLLSVRREGKRKYVSIQMLSTEVIYENILFCAEVQKEKKYMLYEKCHLKYVDQIPLPKVHGLNENCKIIGGKTIRQKK